MNFTWYVINIYNKIVLDYENENPKFLNVITVFVILLDLAMVKLSVGCFPVKQTKQTNYFYIELISTIVLIFF